MAQINSRAKGEYGELRLSYAKAVTFGAWDLAIGTQGRVDASQPKYDPVLFARHDADFSCWLRIGRSWWVWRGVEIVQTDGSRLQFRVKGNPEVR